MIAKLAGIIAALLLCAWLYWLTFRMQLLLDDLAHLIAGQQPRPRLTVPDPPPTEPSGIPLQVHGALLKPRPTPHPTVSRELGGRTFQFREDQA